MARTPSRRNATDSVQRVNRRLMTILLPLAAASLTAGCTTFSDADAVARVGDTELSEDQLDELLDEQQFPEEARSDLTLVRPVISGWIEQTAIENGLFGPEVLEAIPEADLLALYDEGIAASGVACVDLMVAESPEAGEVAAERLRDGEAFADVLADVNIDPDLAAVGGEVGCFDSSQFAGVDPLPPEVVALFSVNAADPFASAPSPNPDGSAAALVIAHRGADEIPSADVEQVLQTDPPARRRECGGRRPRHLRRLTLRHLRPGEHQRHPARLSSMTSDRPSITVVGLGPGHPDHVTTDTLATIERIPRRHLRTAIHPSAHLVTDAVGGAIAHDDLYDDADTFEEVYTRIVDRLVADARDHGTILYAVPGSPLVLERTVRLLSQRCPAQDIDLDVRPAMSFLDVAWARLGIDPVEERVRLIDGHDFAAAAAGETGPLLVAHTHANWVLSDIKLAVEDAAGDESVTILHALGTADERIVDTTWADMDRAIDADHLTSIYVPRLAAPVGRHYVRFHELARTLRERCPWDIEQTHESLIPYLLEETYEVIDALQALADPERADDPTVDDDLVEELGDLLYQIEFHAVIAEQQGRFTIADVAEGIHDKLVRRHPHVFGDVALDGADEVLANWDEIKRVEKGRTSVFDGIPRSLPSLSYAAAVGRKASKVGFDWPDVSGALPKVREETDELTEAIESGEHGHTVAELGDLLFAVVNVARHVAVDPELALRAASDKFRARFEGVERFAVDDGIDLRSAELHVLDALWDRVKASER